MNGYKVKGTYNYEIPAFDKGYAGQTLYVNVDTAEISAKKVTAEMKAKFTGGRGFGLFFTVEQST